MILQLVSISLYFFFKFMETTSNKLIFRKIILKKFCIKFTIFIRSSVNSLSSSGPSCGEVKMAVPLVTSGQSTYRGQWPWHVALYLIEGINLSYHCGGSLISKNKVITGKLCILKRLPPIQLL